MIGVSWHAGHMRQELRGRGMVNVREGALALYDRIKSLIIRPLCVILHSLRHDLIPVLGPASAVTTHAAASLAQMGTQI